MYYKSIVIKGEEKRILFFDKPFTFRKSYKIIRRFWKNNVCYVVYNQVDVNIETGIIEGEYEEELIKLEETFLKYYSYWTPPPKPFRSQVSIVREIIENQYHISLGNDVWNLIHEHVFMAHQHPTAIIVKEWLSSLWIKQMNRDYNYAFRDITSYMIGIHIGLNVADDEFERLLDYKAKRFNSDNGEYHRKLRKWFSLLSEFKHLKEKNISKYATYWKVNIDKYTKKILTAGFNPNGFKISSRA